MIATGFETRIKVQEIVENQLPSFVVSDFPKTTEFLKQYYISQEHQGASIDIVENLDQYLKLDNLTVDVVSGISTLSADISSSDTTIFVTNTKGYPQQYGLIQIDNEIITYTGITTNSFTGCVRGFSGITEYDKDGELVFQTSQADSHSQDTSVTNLSSLFLKEFYKKIKFLLTPGLENLEFVPNLNVNNFIKQAKNFYQAKGTTETFRILFNILYNITPEIVDLEKFLIKPSQAEFRRNEVVTADVISGDPLKLIGQALYKKNDAITNASISHVELVKEGLKEYFRILLFVGYTDETNVVGNFSITPTTKVLENTSIGSSIISVDSTIGFPKSGTLISGINTAITYTDKSINQFFGCVGIASTIYTASSIRTDEIYYGYEDGDLTKKVELRITGVLSDYVSLSDTFSSSEGEKIFVKNIGDIIKNPSENKSFKEIFANSWIYNTSSRYEIESISGSSPTFNLILYSNTDKSSLRVGDRIDIISRGSQDVLYSNALVTNINSSNTKYVTINASGFSPVNGYLYDIRRKIKKANSSSNPELFGTVYGNNSIISDTLNVYSEEDEHFYVASNSLPSYSLNVSFASTSISDSSPSSFTIQGQNPITEKYSIISFASNVPFITGDSVYYLPENDPLEGLTEGVYYVEVLNPKNKIRLYSSKSFIIAGEWIEFDQPVNDGRHTFTLRSQKDRIIGPQKIFKKFPDQKNILAPIESLTPTNSSIGMLINGVEIINYKSSDRIYYGPLKSVNILNGGTGYDVVNPPKIKVSSPISGETAQLEPIIEGELEDILIDPHEFDIGEALGVTISGGNNFDCLLEPVTETVYRQVSFEAREIRFGGGLDIGNDTITFKQDHNFKNGEPIVYSNNGNNSIGVGPFLGSNANQNKTLEDSGIYYAQVLNSKTIKIYGSYSDYSSGINTVGFTTMYVSGTHKFLPYNGRRILTKVNVLGSSNKFTYKKLYANPSDISKENSYVRIINHGFNDGELIQYGNIGTPISGLSTTNQYYVISLDSDRFRLCNAGIGGSIRSFYDRGEYVIFQSVGVGTHTFRYPKISINVKISNPVGVVTATAVVRGSITGVNISNKGSGYGSNILNLHNKPTTKFISGKGAALSPVISNGKLVRVNIQNRGYQYYSTPDIIISGEGVGAKIRPIIDSDGRIIQVIIINGGIGYRQSTTTIKVLPAGVNCLLDLNVRDLTINNKMRFGNEILIDRGNYVQYGYVGYSTNIGYSEFGDQKNGSSHSPIIGWSYDGCPIYGPYGLSDPTDLNSEIKLLSSGYELDTSIVEDRPPGFDAGVFVDDYKFADSGDLDFNNGRFTKTIDFPNGVYAYFATVSNLLESEFPYFIGNKFNYLPIEENFSKKFNQSFDFNSSNLIRNTFPHRVGDPYSTSDFIIQPNQISPQQSKIEDIESGKVNSYTIVQPGDGYAVGDRLIFDNSGTGGGGVTGYVSELEGKKISNIDTSISIFSGSTIHWKDPNTILVNTKKIHNFYTGDNVNISGITSDTVNQKIKGSYSINVPFAQTRLLTDLPPNPVLVSNNNIDITVADIPQNIGVGDSISISRSNGTSEIFSILNIFENEKILRVNRGTVTSIGHTASSFIRLLPSKFELNVKSDVFISKENNVVYFSAKQSVGTGTYFGIDNSVEYTVGTKKTQVSIPSQSIYLPNHPFETGQKVLFRKTSQALPLSAYQDGRGTFSIPRSGNTQTLYVIKKSKDYIGLTTAVGLTTNTGGVFFSSNGSDNYRYSLESQFDQIKCDIDRYVAKISLNTPHSLKNGDIINLQVKEVGIVGIGTSSHIRVKYNSTYDRLLIDTVGFSSAAVNLETNSIFIPNNNFISGDKVFYKNNSQIISGLSTGDYYIFKDSRDTIQLCKTYKDAISTPPNLISFSSAGGNSHEISLINPKISLVEYKTPKFLLNDSSLSGYKFKIFTDKNLSEEFYSERLDNTFNVSGVGTVGISSQAYLTLDYSPNLPKKLYYALEKDGKVVIPDDDVLNYSQIEFMPNVYNDKYTISNVAQKSFNIAIKKYPNTFNLNSDNTVLLKYTTKSPNDVGGVNKITLPFGGTGYKKIPSVVNISSKLGNSANIILNSDSIGKLNSVRVLNLGFDYSVDKTLKPQSYVSPVITLTDSDTITDVIVLDGGRQYTTPPKLIIYNSYNKEIPQIGRVIPKMGSGTIEDVIIEEDPIGLNPVKHRIISVNNDNGIVINQVQSSTVGIVTCFLSTPLLGYVNPPFKVGDKVFIENIEKNDETGTGFNSKDYDYQFFEIVNYYDTNPIQVEYTLSGFTTNPGIAKTFQFGYPMMVNYNNYPKFDVVQDKLKFYDQEQLLVLDNTGYTLKDIFVTESFKDYIKVFGTYDLLEGQKIKGKNSGALAKINSVRKNTGFFKVDYSLKESYGWNDNTGFISDDLQFIADNDYYQNLSYTIRSPLEYQTTIDPVKRVLHTSGLKNFADTRIENNITTVFPTTTLIDSINTLDLVNDSVRVDTIYNLDLGIDVYATEERSKYIKLKNRKLTDYIECLTNRVLLMDDISGFFRNKENVKDLNVSILEYPISQKYSSLLIQIKDFASFDLKIHELVIINNSVDVFTLEKTIVSNTDKNFGDIEVVLDTDYDSVSVYFKPFDPYNKDYDIKILESKFNSNLAGIGSTSLGFVTLTGRNSIATPGITTSIISGAPQNLKALFVMSQVINNTTQEMNYFETYLTNNGSDTFMAESCFDSRIFEFTSGNFIGTFRSSITSGILKFDYENTTSNPVTVRSRVIGFGQTSIGIGTYQFASEDQIEGTERTLKYESSCVVSTGSTDILSVYSYDISAVKSYIRVSVGDTSALHQVVNIHDNYIVYTTQYPYLSVNQDSGIGTFGGRVEDNNMIISFYPDPIYSSSEVTIEMFNEIINSDIDYLNIPQKFDYGKVSEEMYIRQYDALNGKRINRLSFDARWNKTPIFVKTFNPKSNTVVNKQTGVFTIRNHFFSDGEEVIYTPNSSLFGIPAQPLGIGATADYTGIVTTTLPRVVYVNRLNKDQFRLSTRKEYESVGIFVTFTNSGSGNIHTIEMAKKNEKTIITLNGVIQAPLTTTNLVYPLTNNTNGIVGVDTNFVSISGIGSIFPTDVLKIGNEYMSVVNLGYGSSSGGPITNSGPYALASVERGTFGSIATDHYDGDRVEVLTGGYNIVGNKIYFVSEPKGSGIGVTIDRDTGIPYVKSSFNGRVYLRSDYTNNKIYDDISPQFTGIGQSFTLTQNGLTTTGVEPGSGILIINGIFQTPTTENNVGNNYYFEEDTIAGLSTVTFTGITSEGDGSLIVTDADVNQNQLPRNGMIVSLGSTPGLGYAPLVGASVTAVVGAGGSIVSVGLGLTDNLGSGYRGLVSIGITDLNHTGTAASITAIAGIGGTLSFIINDGGSGYSTSSVKILPPEPIYENLPIVGVFRSGIGETTDTGIGLLVNVEIGPSEFTPVGRFADAAATIEQNKTLIAETAVGRMLDNYPGFSVPGGNQNCIDDVKSVLSSIIYDLKFGGNESVHDAAKIYIDNNYLAGEEEESIYTFHEAKDMAIQAMRNEPITVKTLTSGRNADAARLIDANKQLIAEVAVGRMLAYFSGFSVPGGNQNCIDDIVDVLETIVYNLKYGGNEQVYDAAEIYLNNSYLSGEEQESAYAFEQARDMAIQAMRNEAITIGGYSALSQYFDTTIEGDISGLPGVYNTGDCADVASAITQFVGIVTSAILDSSIPGSRTESTSYYTNEIQFFNNTIEGDISGLPGVYNPGDCADVASAITQFVGIVTNAIGFATLPTKTVSKASLYQVSSFKIPRTGYSFQIGDVFKVVGLVTDKNLSEPIEEFKLSVLEIFTDRFAAWQFGELDFIDPITNFQDGKRVRFPLYYNSELLSFEKNLEDADSAAIDLNAVVLIFVNGVIQDPYKNYRFEGGTSIVFTTPPKPADNVSIFFYRGGRGIDSVLINVRETIKEGDTVQLSKRNSISDTVSQYPRKVSTIFASDVVETNLYLDQGIDELTYKPLDWYRQKADISIDGLKISKARDSIEGMVYPTAKIIKSLKPNDMQIFVDDAQFFNYEENQSDIVISYLDAFIITNNNPVAAAVTAVVSTSGTIQNLIINNVGDGYVGIGSTLPISIAQPDNLRIEGLHGTYGIGVTATAEAAIVDGKITTINITNPGVGYTFTNPPNVICPTPAPNYENVLDITRVQGFSGIITGITTTTGTNGHPLALRLFTRSNSYQGLQIGFPIYVYDTTTGNGLVSVGTSDPNELNIGTTKLNNIYEIRSITYNGINGQFVVNIKSNTPVSGIATIGTATNPVGRFSWGRFFGLKRSKIKQITLDLKNYVVDAGLSTFPEIHRRGFGLRSTGALRKDLG